MVMLLYLDNSFDRAKQAGKMLTREDLWAAVHEGAVKRIRPKAMTVRGLHRPGTAPVGPRHRSGRDAAACS